jgi:hypothetical protein
MIVDQKIFVNAYSVLKVEGNKKGKSRKIIFLSLS